MNTIGKRYSQDLCRHLRILVILHGIMFLIFFFDNKLSFEYNMAKLVAFGTKFTKFKNVHNCANSEKQDSNDAMGLRSVLFLSDGAEVVLTSNIWVEAGLYHGAKGQVIDFV